MNWNFQNSWPNSLQCSNSASKTEITNDCLIQILPDSAFPSLFCTGNHFDNEQ